MYKVYTLELGQDGYDSHNELASVHSTFEKAFAKANEYWLKKKNAPELTKVLIHEGNCWTAEFEEFEGVTITEWEVD